MICYHCMKDVNENYFIGIYNRITVEQLTLMINNKVELPLPDFVVCVDCKNFDLPGTEKVVFN